PSIRVIGVRIDGTFQQVNGGSEVEASVGLLGLPKQIGRFGFGRRSSSDSFGTAHDVGVHIFVIADDFLKSFVVIPAGSRHFSGLVASVGSSVRSGSPNGGEGARIRFSDQSG